MAEGDGLGVEGDLGQWGGGSWGEETVRLYVSFIGIAFSTRKRGCPLEVGWDQGIWR